MIAHFSIQLIKCMGVDWLLLIPWILLFRFTKDVGRSVASSSSIVCIKYSFLLVILQPMHPYTIYGYMNPSINHKYNLYYLTFSYSSIAHSISYTRHDSGALDLQVLASIKFVYK